MFFVTITQKFKKIEFFFAFRPAVRSVSCYLLSSTTTTCLTSYFAYLTLLHISHHLISSPLSPMDPFLSSRRSDDCSRLNIISDIPQEEQEPVTSNTTASPTSIIITTRTRRSPPSLHNKQRSEGSSDSIMIRTCHEPPAAATLSTFGLLLMQPDDPTFLLRRCLRYDWDSVGRLLECMNDLLSCDHPPNDYYLDCMRNQLVQTEVDGNNPLQVCCHFEPPVEIIRLFRRVLRKAAASNQHHLLAESQSYTNHQHQTALLIACDHDASIPVIRELLSFEERVEDDTTTSDQQTDRLLSRHDVDHRNVFDSLYDRLLRNHELTEKDSESETEFLPSSQRCLSSLLLFRSSLSSFGDAASSKLTTDLWKLILDLLEISNVADIYPSLARRCHLLPSELVDALVSVAVIPTEEETKNEDITTALLYTLMQVRLDGQDRRLSPSSSTTISIQKKRQAYVCQQLLLQRNNHNNPEQEPLSTKLVLYAIRQALSYQHHDEDSQEIVRLFMDHRCPDEVDKILPQAVLVAAAHNTVDTTYRLLQTDPSMIQNAFCIHKYDKAK